MFLKSCLPCHVSQLFSELPYFFQSPHYNFTFKIEKFGSNYTARGSCRLPSRSSGHCAEWYMPAKRLAAREQAKKEGKSRDTEWDMFPAMTSFQNVDFKAKTQPLLLVTTSCIEGDELYLVIRRYSSKSWEQTGSRGHFSENFINSKNKGYLFFFVFPRRNVTYMYIYTKKSNDYNTKLSNLLKTTTCKNILVLIWNFIENISSKYATESGWQLLGKPVKENTWISMWPHQLHFLTSERCSIEMRQLYCKLISVSLSTWDHDNFLPHLRRAVREGFLGPAEGSLG